MKKGQARWLGLCLVMAFSLSLLSACGARPLTVAIGDGEIVAATRFGDVNGDDGVDMKDVLLLRKSVAGIGDAVDEAAGDVNGDNSVDMKDVLLLRRYVAKLVSRFPIEDVLATTTTTTATTKRTQPTWPTKTPIDSEHPVINFIQGSEATLGVWWWVASDGINETLREQYMDFLEENQVTEIYYYGANRLTTENSRAEVHTFVQAAMKHGFRVAALFDNQAVVKAGNTSFTGLVEGYSAYRKEYPTDALYGIHCDIEPQASARVSKTTWVEWVQGYTDNFIVAQIAPARAAGVTVELDIGCGWWRYGREVAYTGSATHTYEGTTMDFNDIMANNCDCMCMMSYRDTAKAVLEMADTQRAAADKAGTKIVYGVETGDDGEGAYVDFSADSKEIMYTELSRLLAHLEAEPPVGAYGFAIHHTRPWYNLRDTLQSE